MNYDQVRSSSIKYDQVRSSTIKFDQVQPGAMNVSAICPKTLPSKTSFFKIYPIIADTYAAVTWSGKLFLTYDRNKFFTFSNLCRSLESIGVLAIMPNEPNINLKDDGTSEKKADALSIDAVTRFNASLEAVTGKKQKQSFQITIFCIFLALVTNFSGLGKIIDESISAPIDFNIRSYFRLDPVISPNLKVFTLDDLAVSMFKKTNLSLAEWAKILLYIDKHNPKAIYIDKIFGVGYGESDEDKRAIEDLKKIKAPVYVGSFISGSKNKFRDTIPEKLPNNQMKDLNQNQRQYNYIYDLRKNAKIAYGPKHELLDVFQVAHIDFSSSLSFSPVFRLNDQTMIYYLGISGQEIQLEDDQIKIADKKVDIAQSKILFNLLDYKKNYSRVVRSIAGLQARIDQGIPLDNTLRPDDHIIILPEAYTGSADFKSSPFGSIVAGWFITSAVNSSLTGQWLKRFDPPLLIILAVFAMGLFASFSRERYAWLVVALASIILPALGISLFCLASVVTPWLTTSFFVSMTGISVLAMRAQLEKEKEKILENMFMESELTKKENIEFSIKNKIFEQEKREAAAIAKAFRPDKIPDWEGLKILGFHKSIDSASGDWFFFDQSENGKYFHIVLCDITGHGVQAALIVSTCKSVLNSLRKYQPNARDRLDFTLEYLNTLNEILYKQGQGQHTCTLIGVTLEPKAGKIYLVSCGHPPALLNQLGKYDQKPALLRTKADPLGFQETIEIQQKIFDWSPGDQLILNTDGVPLVENIRHLQEFMRDPDRPLDSLASDLYHHIWGKIKIKTQKQPDDDVSLLIIRFIS